MFRRSRRHRDPHPAPRFVAAPVPARLCVPSGVGADDAAPDWRPPGTTVGAGDRLTVTTAEAVVPPVAPVGGRVGDPVVVRLPDGRSYHAVELWTDRPPTDADGTGDAAAPLALPSAAVANALAVAGQADLAVWIDRLAGLGVTADRWASPDLGGQLRQALRRPVDTVVCNLLDSDPWLGVNRAVAAAFAVEVAAGAGLLGRLTAAKHVWAMVDQAEPAAAWEPLRSAAAMLAGDLRIAPIENDYPQPDPTLLVYAATRRRLRPGHLPTDQGVLLVDAAAAAAVGRAALASVSPALGPIAANREPGNESALADPRTAVAAASDGLMARVPVVVYDQPADVARAVSVVPGTTVGEVLAFVGVPTAVREVYAGSPLRQRVARASDVIGPGELTLFAAPPQPVPPAAPCIGCGWCAEGCPTGCRPAGLLESAQQEDPELARRNGLDACIECGLCTYVCPSRLPILAGIRQLRRMGEG